MKEYPSDEEEFAGLYGYNMTYLQSGFLKGSNRFYVFPSDFKGQHRIYLVDYETKEVKWLNFLSKSKDSQLEGDYDLLRKFEDCLMLSYKSLIQPTQVYFLKFKDVAKDSLSDLLSEDNLVIKLVSEQSFDLNSSNQFKTEFNNHVKGCTKELIYIDSGAQGVFIKPGNLDSAKKHPMVVKLHGGPFGAYPQDIFLKSQHNLLLQGFCILAVNFRGSTGFGQEFMDSLLGNIGVKDVEDVGELTKKAIGMFPDLIDERRIGVEGGSHGGFLTGWMIGHPKYSSLYACGSLWNPCIDLNFMI